MIGYVKGIVTDMGKDYCFVETGGIGYRIFISGKDSHKLNTGEETKLLTYMSVREDAILLYGFLTKEAYDLFLVLIAVSKIGPKVALGILSALSPQAFSTAIAGKDLAVLTGLPGIGKKTAERLVVELKDKIGNFSNDSDTHVGNDVFSVGTGSVGEAATALQSLGYEAREFTEILERMAPRYEDTSKLLGAVLRELGKAGRG